MLQQMNISVKPQVTGYVHMLTGLSYSMDPIVYILVRKTSKMKIFNLICRCRKNEIGVEQ